jgi:hypothetical protein
MRIRVHGVFICLLLSSAVGVQVHRRTVYIAQYGHDAVGQEVAYRLREEVAKSARYKIAPESQSELKIELVSADEGEARFADRGTSSAISYVFTIRSSACAERDWLFLKQGVYIAGKDRTAVVAQGILGTLDKALNQQ